MASERYEAVYQALKGNVGYDEHVQVTNDVLKALDALAPPAVGPFTREILHKSADALLNGHELTEVDRVFYAAVLKTYAATLPAENPS